jgi:hypothetical protein
MMRGEASVAPIPLGPEKEHPMKLSVSKVID